MPTANSRLPILSFRYRVIHFPLSPSPLVPSPPLPLPHLPRSHFQMLLKISLKMAPFGANLEDDMS